MDPLLRFGAWAERLTWAAIPCGAQARALAAFRDTVGVILGGAGTKAGRIATETALRSRGLSAIPGGGGRCTPMLAAFAGAVNASALDFDDGHYRGGAIHPSSVILPALLVAAESAATGDRFTYQDLLTAQVVGYEIGLRAAALLWPRHADDDYHCTGTAAALGAAAAVTRLRGGTAEQIARSIAIAWAHAPMSTFQLPMVKESIGWSAATALFASDLADMGFMRLDRSDHSAMAATFPPTPFHRPGAMDQPIVASLGQVFETEQIYTKPYASCRYTHTALRSLAELMASEHITAEQVEHIEVFTPRASMNLTDPRPASLDHAQYSFPFTLATLLVTGACGGAELAEESLDDPVRLSLAARITVQHDPALDPTYPAHYATRLRVWADGRTFDLIRLVAPGDPADPMSPADLTAKFVALVAPVFGEDSARTSDAVLTNPASDMTAVLGCVGGNRL